MKRMIGLVFLIVIAAMCARAQPPPVQANRVIQGAGAPASGLCHVRGDVGKVYARNNGAAANSTFYVCANTAASTYAWELLGTGGGGGSGTGAVYVGALSGIPATCTVGQTAVITDATPGTTGYECYATNTWIQTWTAAPGSGILISQNPTTAVWTFSADPTITAKFSPPATLTDGATVTWAIGSFWSATATLTFTVHSGSRTLNLTGLVAGGYYTLYLIQDGTGGEGITLGTGCTWKVNNSGAGAVTLSSTANAKDALAFQYDGTNCNATLGTKFN